MLRLPRTLFGRMTLGVALITGILLATEAWLLSWQIHSSIQDMHALLLEAASTPITERLRQDGVAGLQAPLPAATARRFNPESGTMRYAVLAPDGRLLAASAMIEPNPAPSGLPQPDLLARPRATFRSSSPEHRAWGLSRHVQTPQGLVVLQVAQDMRNLFVMLDDVPGATLGPMLVAYAVGAMLLVLLFASLTGLALRPLNRAAAQAAGIAPGSGQRLDETGLPVEARPFVSAVNGWTRHCASSAISARTWRMNCAPRSPS